MADRAYPNQILSTTPYHRNGTASNTAAVVDLTKNSDGRTFASTVFIHNNEPDPATDDALQISFDATNFFSITPGTTLEIHGCFFTVSVKAATSAVYSMLCIADRYR